MAILWVFWHPGGIPLDSWRDSDHIGGLGSQIGPFGLKNHHFWKQARVSGSGVALQGQFFFSRFWIFPDLLCLLKVLKSWDSEPGTPLERSGSKFCAKSRARELRSIYGDPFPEDFVPVGVDEGSGPGSHTFVSLWQTHRSALNRHKIGTNRH